MPRKHIHHVEDFFSFASWGGSTCDLIPAIVQFYSVTPRAGGMYEYEVPLYEYHANEIKEKKKEKLGVTIKTYAV